MKNRSALQFSPGAAGPVIVRVARVQDLSWQDASLCGQVGGDIWFPEKGGSVAQAKAICRGCPVRVPCLEYALENGERHGIWGGKSERERRKLARGRTPTLRRCRKGLHVMTEENTIGSGACRACKQAAERSRPKRMELAA